MIIDLRFELFEHIAKTHMEKIEENSLKSLSEKAVIEIRHRSPEAHLIETAFGYEAVNMRIPFQISAECMQDADKTGNELPGVIQIIKITGDNLVDSLKKAVQQRTVFQEERTEPLINGKNAMTVRDLDQFKRHGSSAFCGIRDTASWTKPAVTAERDIFGITTFRAGIKRSAKRRVTAVDHLLNVVHFNITRMTGIFNFFVMIPKDLLQNVHSNIIHITTG